jgi:hypothetical protein
MKETFEYQISVPLYDEIKIIPILKRLQATQKTLGDNFGFERVASSLEDKKAVYKLSFKLLHTLFSVAVQLSQYGHKIGGEVK